MAVPEEGSGPLDKIGADTRRVQVAGLERGERVSRAFDDRFAVVEERVQDDRHASELKEGFDQRPVSGRGGEAGDSGNAGAGEPSVGLSDDDVEQRGGVEVRVALRDEGYSLSGFLLVPTEVTGEGLVRRADPSRPEPGGRIATQALDPGWWGA